MNKRIITGLVTGAILGVVCILGGSTRVGGWEGNGLFLFAMWYNRVIIGLLIGIAPVITTDNPAWWRNGRALALSTAVTLAFGFSTAFRDIPSVIAGVVYGLITEFVIGQVTKKR